MVCPQGGPHDVGHERRVMGLFSSLLSNIPTVSKDRLAVGQFLGRVALNSENDL